ncbi:sensor domain-containing diguanylate cyclase [Haliovirga abyssi]|uniref:Diguanylate cyclase n=1 Tax=Haliovirga abyssi TaxID=2996794 RepID=A0AAU9DBI0_9FUSO|nr:diguanylate cyclase [Haliovirga abyssi]BDU50811.1 hypothetical protein HLVA_13800 [Haliovirga abyssi]
MTIRNKVIISELFILMFIFLFTFIFNNVLLKKVTKIETQEYNIMAVQIKENILNDDIIKKYSNLNEINIIIKKGNYKNEGIKITKIGDKTITGYFSSEKLKEKIILDKYRNYYNSIKKILKTVEIIFFLLIVLIEIIIILIIDKKVLKRIDTLDNRLKYLVKEKEFFLNIDVNGNDEVSSIKNNLNRLLDTIRKITEENQEKQDELERIIYNLPIYIGAVDEKHNIVMWNKMCKEKFGYDREDISTLEKLIEKLAKKDKDKKERILDYMENGKAEDSISGEIITKDGTIRSLKVINMSHIHIKGWKIWIVGIDITETKKYQKTLEREKEKYKLLYEENSAIHMLISESLDILDVNKMFEETLHYEKKDIIGENFVEIIADGNKEKFLENFETIFLGDEVKDLEVKVYDRFMKEKYLLISISNAIIEEEESYEILITAINISDRKKMEKQLEIFANYDSLTGLFNRRIGLDILNQKMKEANRYKNDLSICFVDVNRLKYVNDNFGHSNGDILIQTVAEAIISVKRDSDILCRIGGDEFLIIFDKCNVKQAEFIWDRIKEKFEEYSKDLKFEVTASHGIVEYEENTVIDDFVKKADEKMYVEKEKNKLKNS